MAKFGRPREEGQLRTDFAELDTSPSDRARAIIGVSLIEEWLEISISNRLTPDSGIARQFFGPGGGLETFSGKSRLGYLLRIYNKQFLETLEALGSIRSRFAHFTYIRDFSHPELQDFFSKLHLYEEHQQIYKSSDDATRLLKMFLPTSPPPSRPDNKSKFIWTVKLVMATLLVDVMEAMAPMEIYRE